MTRFIKKHIGLIIIIIIVIVFPNSLLNQAKLNMRIIVTGIAIDKDDEKYQVTAQIVKTKSNSQSLEQGSEIDFISESSASISTALASLLYKTGKVSAFSHTNFVIIGKDLTESSVTDCLDIFMRDKTIKNSALLLFAEGKASDEIKKTKKLDLSVGVELQKVYAFKQEDSDALMMTLLDFVNYSQMYSKTAAASTLKFASDEKSSSENGGSSTGESGGADEIAPSSELGENTNQNSQDSGNSNGGSETENQASSGGDSKQNGGQSSGKQSSVTFESLSPIYFFVDGKLKLKLEDKNDVLSYLICYPETKKCYIDVDKIEFNDFKADNIAVMIKEKSIKKKIHFEQNIPCMDLKITIKNAEINEIISKNDIYILSQDECDGVKKEIVNKLKENISSVFDSAKASGVDIFGAYELAYKFKYKTLNKYYDSSSSFLENLKFNVEINIKNLEK